MEKSITKQHVIMFSVLIVIAAVAINCLIAVGIKKDLIRDYEQGIQCIENGDYQDAIKIFDMLEPGFRDSEKYSEYATALTYYDSKRFTEAEALFKALGGFEQSEEYLEKTEKALADQEDELRYNEACRYFLEGDYSNAYALFSDLGDYNDSVQYAAESKELMQ